MNFSAALAAEISALEAELESDPRYVKLKELRRLGALYPIPNMGEPAPKPLEALGQRAISGQRGARRTSSVRRKAIEEAKNLIRGKSAPTKTKEIFTHLDLFGIEIGGKFPENNLSAMLHNHPDFVSHGRAGWTLKENEAPTGNPDEASETEG